MYSIKKTTLVLAVCLVSTLCLTKDTYADPLDGWPKQSPVAPIHLKAVGEDKLSIFDCYRSFDEGRPGTPAQAFLLGDTVQPSSLFTQGSQTYLPWIVSCNSPHSTFSSPDGTLYMGVYKGNTIPSHTVRAEKNGNTLWETAIIVCPSSSYKYGEVRAAQIGATGLLHVIIAPNDGNNCGDVFATINPANGLVLSQYALPVSSGYQERQIWAYADEVLAMDRSGSIHYFNKDGSPSTIHTTNNTLVNRLNYGIWADSNKNVYSRNFGMSCSGHKVTRVEPSGVESDLYSLPSGGSNCNFETKEVSSGDTVAVTSVQNNPSVTKYTENSSPITLGATVPTGKREDMIRVDVDTNGNVIYTSRRYDNSTYAHGTIIVRLYNFSTSMVSEIWNSYTVTQDDDLVNNILGDIYGNYLYTSLCHQACSPNSQSASQIYKIPLTGFGQLDQTRGLFSSFSTDADGDSLSLRQEIEQRTLDSKKDSDGDGLNDDVESIWYQDRDDVFCGTHCAYPNPIVKDVYVELDWMDDGATEYKPSNTQINLVRDAFDNKGMNLHVDTGQFGGGNELSIYTQSLHRTVTTGQIDFWDYKNGGDGVSSNFSANRGSIWRYMVYGYEYFDPNGTSSGWAETMGDDIFISGGWIEEDSQGYASLDRAIANTIMHEIGHNLCLSDDRVWTEQPAECIYDGIDNGDENDAEYNLENYESVMNYRYQLTDVDDMGIVDYSDGSHETGDHDDWGGVMLGMGGFTGTHTLLGAKLAQEHYVTPDGGIIIDETLKKNTDAKQAQEELQAEHGLSAEEVQLGICQGKYDDKSWSASEKEAACVKYESTTGKKVDRDRGSEDTEYVPIMIAVMAMGAIVLITAYMTYRYKGKGKKSLKNKKR